MFTIRIINNRINMKIIVNGIFVNNFSFLELTTLRFFMHINMKKTTKGST